MGSQTLACSPAAVAFAALDMDILVRHIVAVYGGISERSVSQAIVLNIKGLHDQY